MTTQSLAERLKQLSLQLQQIQASPWHTKPTEQQKLAKEEQQIQQQINNMQAFMSMSIGMKVTKGLEIGEIADLKLSPGGMPEAWVSWQGKVPIPEQPCRLKIEPEESQANEPDSEPLEVEVVEFEDLTEEEEKERLRLEREVEKAFSVAGRALRQLRDKRLYRATHPTFESYCLARFGFQRRHCYQLIDAAQVVDNLISDEESEMCANGAQILPTSERQVRPLSQLEPEEQRQAWQQAITEAGGKVPSGRIVKDIVQRIRERSPVPNPWNVGDVCSLIVKDNPDLRGKGGCWAIVTEVHQFSCTVRTWEGECLARIENLKELHYSPEQRKEVQKLCERLNRLTSAYDEESVKAILESLGQLQRPYLTAIEEKLLSFLEAEDAQLQGETEPCP